MFNHAKLSSRLNQWIWHCCAELYWCALCRLSSWWQPPSSGGGWRVQQLLRGQHLSRPRRVDPIRQARCRAWTSLSKWEPHRRLGEPLRPRWIWGTWARRARRTPCTLSGKRPSVSTCAWRCVLILAGVGLRQVDRRSQCQPFKPSAGPVRQSAQLQVSCSWRHMASLHGRLHPAVSHQVDGTGGIRLTAYRSGLQRQLSEGASSGNV